MKTSKGSSFANLLDITIDGSVLTLHHRESIGIDIAEQDMTPVIAKVTEIITTDKRGKGELEKALLQVELYREHLIGVYKKIFEIYGRLTTPQTRTSPIDKARFDMFASLPDKLLRMNCAIYIGDEKADDFILPSERMALIDMTIKTMKERDGK